MGRGVAPFGCKKLLEWTDQRYGRPPVYITENGCALAGEDDFSVARDDHRRIHYSSRIQYSKTCLADCLDAVEQGVDIRGYMCWSLMDNFERAYGYTKRFGLHWVDFATGERRPKSSAIFWGG
jgi:beta-glucosidase/6-phospho-beta-glucosidase/beta-galactosidase